jgi:protein-tyrosine phosphatase
VSAPVPAAAATAAREDPPRRVAVVCLGNICRSPIAEVVLRDRLASAGLGERVEVLSAGTGGWHVGGPMDERAAAVLTGRGYDASRHRARQVDPGWLATLDLVLAMDEQNLRDLEPLVDHGRLRMFRELDPEAGPDDLDVPDPYFGGEDGFDEVLTVVERTADALVAAWRER